MSAPISQIVHTFTGGEWSKDLHQRFDLEQYFSACEICRNTIPSPQGGASNRPGLHYLTATKNSGSSAARMHPFIFSYKQAYGLVFENLCLRFLKDGGQLLTGTVAAWVTATVYNVGDLRSNAGTSYYCKTAHTSGTFATDLAAGKWYAMPAGGILEIPLPYTTAQLEGLKFSQSADTLVITHPDVAPSILTRTSHVNWQFSAINFGATQQPPTTFATGTAGTKVYALTAVSSSGEESVLSNEVSSTDTAAMTWVAAANAVAYNFYEKIYGSWGWKGQVGAVTGATLSAMSPTFASTSPDFDKGPPTAVNYFGSVENYPGCSTFHQQRLLFARTNNSPQNVFGSASGQPYSFNKSSPVQADDSFNFPIAVSEVTGVPQIKHILSFAKGVFVFSEAGESLMNGYNGAAITPTSVNIEPQSNWGCSDMKPLIAGKSVIFVDRTGKRVRDLMYQITFDGYETNDLSVMALHLFDDGEVKSWCFTQYPQPMIWAVTTDGRLITLAYSLDRKQQIIAWHRHDTDGYFEDIIAVPNASKRHDIYVVVRRVINGSTVRYIELLNDRSFTDHQDGFFVDSGVKIDNPITITGATKASPCVVTATSHGFSNGDTVIMKGILGMTELNLQYFKVANVTTHTFTLVNNYSGAAIDSTAFTAYTSGGTVRKCYNTITGLGHLEGKTVVALCDGRVVRDLVVASGSVTLPTPAGLRIAGLPYTWQIKPMRFVTQMQDGTSVNRTRQISEIYARVYRTRSIYAAPDENTTPDEIQIRGEIDNVGAMGLVTEDCSMFMKHSVKPRQGTVCISSSDPCPCTLLDVTAKIAYGEQ